MLERGYDGWRAYRQAKLAQVMTGFDLADLSLTREVVITAEPARPMQLGGHAARTQSYERD